MSEYKNSEAELLNLLRKAEDTDQKNVVSLICNQLSRLYIDYANPSLAEKYSEKALTQSIDVFGDFNLNTASALDCKAYVYYWKKELILADSLYREALRIKKYFLGMENPSYASSLNGLGLVKSGSNEFGEAERLFNYILHIQKNSLSENHPDYATTLHNIGHLKIKEGKIDSALLCFEQALLINTATVGKTHLQCTENIMGIAEIFLKQGKSSEAKKKLVEAKNQYKMLFPFKHPTINYIDKLLRSIPN